MEKPTQLPFLFPVKYKLPASIARQYLRTETRVFNLKSIHDDLDARNARNASDRPDRSERPCTALKQLTPGETETAVERRCRPILLNIY